ncbi:proteasome-activating nucleotidase [Capsaspora owczarzaki ATCC 30864]|uniref:proteasome-activating nucleotidase n=1 Tax=Capsaspora owczarzaki (strain ATCC 30864) TaxID=595528 RepID=UPI0003520D39|nr:proteasome-activating nucleotidase [Capsaspora owczarzaki ATCC 30864]|eukprot:XP_004364904.2 proteasome-activating nucleotidase [Capsaspora owczarzaki ATCC 30864]
MPTSSDSEPFQSYSSWSARFTELRILLWRCSDQLQHHTETSSAAAPGATGATGATGAGWSSMVAATPRAGLILVRSPPGCGKTTFTTEALRTMRVPSVVLSCASVAAEHDALEPSQRGRTLAAAIANASALNVASLTDPSVIPDHDAEQDAGSNGQSSGPLQTRLALGVLVLAQLEALCRASASDALADLLQNHLPRLPPHIICIGLLRDGIDMPPILAKRESVSASISLAVPTAEERTIVIGRILQRLVLQPNPESKSTIDGAALSIMRVTPGCTHRQLAQRVHHALRTCIADDFSTTASPDASPPSVTLDRLLSTILSQRTAAGSAHNEPTPSPASSSATYHAPEPWKNVGGYLEVRKRLIQLIARPQRNPQAYARMGIEPPSGVLLYGPSGCGKTLLINELVASECPEVAFIPVRVSELLSKYLGESERNIRKLFVRARQLAPCIVFFDDIDIIALKREMSLDGGSSGVEDRLLGQLLTEMDGIVERTGVLVVACTNKQLSALDPALIRAGRLEHHVAVGKPGAESRLAILKVLAQRTSTSANLEWVAGRTEGYTGARLTALVREAALCALRRDIEAVTVSDDDFKAALGSAL